MQELLSALREEGWRKALAEEFAKPYFAALASFVAEERDAQLIAPPANLVFRALNTTPLHKVKVVLLGQDPYHGPNQADGLCFSVPEGVRVPPSLRNVFKELEADVPGFRMPKDGDLSSWASQGVLMLNATLTVRMGQANSHAKCGWQTFTDAVIEAVNRHQDGVVFLLWGNFAKQKAKLLDRSKHSIIEAVHPSPLSASRGWFGCRAFSQCNAELSKRGKDEVNWQLEGAASE